MFSYLLDVFFQQLFFDVLKLCIQIKIFFSKQQNY